MATTNPAYDHYDPFDWCGSLKQIAIELTTQLEAANDPLLVAERFDKLQKQIDDQNKRIEALESELKYSRGDHMTALNKLRDYTERLIVDLENAH